MTKTKIQTNVIFEHLNQTDSKIIIEQGGTRSGNTYNILMWIIFQYCETNTGKTITICRKTFPALRGTVMRDFFDILHKHQLYYEELRARSTNEYIINGNRIEFISLSEPHLVFAAFCIADSIELKIISLSIDFSVATASAILKSSTLSDL